VTTGVETASSVAHSLPAGHLPELHAPVPHCTPQVPQLSASLLRSAQLPAHAVSPGAQLAMPGCCIVPGLMLLTQLTSLQAGAAVQLGSPAAHPPAVLPGAVLPGALLPGELLPGELLPAGKLPGPN